jgi:hypothetical protein
VAWNFNPTEMVEQKHKKEKSDTFFEHEKKGFGQVGSLFVWTICT